MGQRRLSCPPEPAAPVPAREVHVSDLLEPACAVPPVTVRAETTCDELAETLAILNAEAKAMSRRGKAYDRDEAWAAWHRRLDAVLSDYEAKAHGRP